MRLIPLQPWLPSSGEKLKHASKEGATGGFCGTTGTLRNKLQSNVYQYSRSHFVLLQLQASHTSLTMS